VQRQVEQLVQVALRRERDDGDCDRRLHRGGSVGGFSAPTVHPTPRDLVSPPVQGRMAEWRAII
jgi:hypothetical protein